MHLGTLGFTIDNEPDGSHLASAPEIEQLGFRTLWVVGGQLDRLDRLTDLLRVTERATVASAIIPPDVYDAQTVTEFYRRAEVAAPGRLLVGLGSPQRPRALTALREYLDLVDAAIPPQRRILAALGPNALDLARERFVGAVPMLVTPAYTAAARVRLGPDRTLAVGLLAVLDDDAQAARATGCQPLSFLTTMRPYVNSLRRQGFRNEAIDALSASMVDQLIAWGRPAEVLDRARQHLAAGADHVQLMVLGGAGQPRGVAAARLLASAMG